jgi:general secretion pathway protein G
MMLNVHFRKNRGASRHHGFTLIEVLLVIVIILMLAGALVVFVLPQQEGAEKNTTKLLLQNIETALDTYRLNMGRYPTTEQGLDALLTKPTFENEKLGEKWNGPYLKPGTKLEDPWGNKLHYELADAAATADDANKNAPRYKLFSVGPDGQPDTTDDIKAHADATDTNGSGATTKSD